MRIGIVQGMLRVMDWSAFWPLLVKIPSVAVSLRKEYPVAHSEQLLSSWDGPAARNAQLVTRDGDRAEGKVQVEMDLSILQNRV